MTVGHFVCVSKIKEITWNEKQCPTLLWPKDPSISDVSNMEYVHLFHFRDLIVLKRFLTFRHHAAADSEQEEV